MTRHKSASVELLHLESRELMARGVPIEFRHAPAIVVESIVSRIGQPSAASLVQSGATSVAGMVVIGGKAARQSASIVVEWNQAMLGAIRASRTAPPLAARNLGMFSVAMHDAMIAADRSFRPMVARTVAPAGTSAIAASAQAGYEVARRLYPEMQSQFGEVLARTLATETNAKARVRGIRVGRRVGELVWNARIADGSERFIEFAGAEIPGQWRPTPPGFAQALLPQWPRVKSMAKLPMRAIMPAGFPDLTSERYALEWEELRSLGAADSTTRTAGQSEIARFWADGEGTITPPGHWNRIAGTAAETTGMGFRQSVRMFAMLNAALCDAGIACWACKYDTNVWRPITAIREADTDGNDATTADPSWTPLLPTPPFPTYVSGHSSFSGAASVILSRYFGRNHPFIDPGDENTTLEPRRFANFNQAAEEAGMSRIYGGIHFQSDNLDGLRLGRQIARIVINQFYSKTP